MNKLKIAYQAPKKKSKLSPEAEALSKILKDKWARQQEKIYRDLVGKKPGSASESSKHA